MSTRSARRQPPPPPKKSRVGLIILIIAIIVVIIIVIIVIILVVRSRSSSTTTCTTSADCATGKVCSSGTCVTGTACTTNANCGTGQICNTTSGICVAGCVDNAGCGTGKVCSSGQCVNGCTSNANCASGQICTAGQCVTSTACTTNSQCPSGKVCDTVGGICVACNTNAECSGATPACVNKTCLACAVNADCPAANPICTSSNTCIECNGNADCSGNTIYSNQGLNICNNNLCVGCQTNGDCTSPATCVSSFCCDPSPPVLTYAVSNVLQTSNSNGTGSFTGTFSYVQAPTSVTYKVFVACILSNLTMSISGNTMSVTVFNTTQYPLKVGQYIFHPSIVGFPKITALGTGVGGAGTYTIDGPAQTLVSGSGSVSLQQYYISPVAQPTATSPQSFTITHADLGRPIEPNSGYFFGIELNVTCGTTVNTVKSNWGYSGTANFSVGQYPIYSFAPSTIDLFPNTFTVSGGANGFNTDPTVQMYISKWSTNSPPLMGLIDGTLIDRAVPKVNNVFAFLYPCPFASLTKTPGQTFYAGFKPWGPTTFFNWQEFSAVAP
uniref:Uncharacterized protein n=1 Tax=viral metagenome TaxID=1070528 RepID=A0A6C0CIJ1_9ZZZZ